MLKKYNTKYGLKTLSEIYRDLNLQKVIKVKYPTAIQRIKNGWDYEKAITTPPIKPGFQNLHNHTRYKRKFKNFLLK